MPLPKLAVATFLCSQWLQANAFLLYRHKRLRSLMPLLLREPIKEPVLYLEKDDNQDTPATFPSRRRLFQSTAASILMPLLVFSGQADAIPPLSVEEADNLKAKAERKLRPKPVQTLRPRLNQDFATLLMTASHQSLDDIDCVPMVRTYYIVQLLSL
jgi:hypothetical protein